MRLTRTYGTGPRVPRGFTLIELLVVIAVIMLLAALTMSAVSRATAQAEKAECANHLHQIGAMTLMYANDYKRRLPPLDAGSHSLWGTNQCIVTIAATYNFEPRNFYCPSGRVFWNVPGYDNNEWRGNADGSRNLGYIHLSYRPPGLSHCGTLHGDITWPRKLTDAASPAQTPYYVDLISLNNYICHSHGTGGNTLMLDWHVESQLNSKVEMHWARNAGSGLAYAEFYW